jgi:HlyD family secretion protein
MSRSTTLQRNAPRSHPRHLVRRWIKRIALVLGGLAGLGAIIYAWLPSPVVVDASVVSRTALDVEVDEDGQARVRDRFVVSAPISGTLERIDLDAGAIVKRGDRIARITPPDPALFDERTRHETTARLAVARARVQQAETAIARAVIAREAAVREGARARALFERSAISGAERDRFDSEEQLAIRDVATAKTERVAAAAEVEAIRATLDQRKPASTGSREVVAPSDGRVLRVIRDSAGPVATGAPLVEIGDPASVEIVVDVLSTDATRIRPGLTASLEGWGGEPLPARVTRIEPSAFTRISALGVEEQRVNVILELEGQALSLGDGFRVDVRIFLWRGAAVLAVPASAVFRDHERWAVYTIEDGRARLRPIAIGHRGRSMIEIAGGLEAGAVVVLHPGDRVREGSRVDAR